MESSSNKKRVRSDSDESEINSPEAKRIRENLLETLDDSETCPVSQDLDSFIKSFEDEITHPPETVDLASDSGESRPDLEFLLEASDDELGLPPTESVELITDSTTESVELITDSTTESVELITDSTTESVELGEYSWLDDQIPNYDSFEYGFDYIDGHIDNNNINDSNENGEYVALDGLFDYTDVGFVSSDLSRRPESLPAQ